ncbi:hypothetical protein ACLBOM_26060 [Escherichia coli]
MKLVRAAARLASRLGSVWHAVYVETPACMAYRKKNIRQFSAPYVWRGWAQRRLHFLIQRKKKQ